MSNLFDCSNINNNQQQISLQFCKLYYHYFDNQPYLLSNLFVNNSKINYLDHTMIGFNSLVDYINQNGIWSFEHVGINVISQPLNNNTILINILGTVSINKEPYYHKFVETLIIKQNIWGNWYIVNMLFRLIPNTIF